MHEEILNNLRNRIAAIKKQYAEQKDKLDEAAIHYMRQQISTSETVIYAIENKRIARNEKELKKFQSEKLLPEQNS